MGSEYTNGKQAIVGREKLFIKIKIGRDDLPPLLICNGLGFDLDTLDMVVNALTDVTVIRFDPPGIGGSSGRYVPYRLAHLASVLNQLMEQLGHDQIDIYGISWGGLLAQEMALNHPERCRRLILASTTMGVASIPGNIFLLGLMRKPFVWFRKDLINKLAALIYGGDIRKRDQLVGRYFDVTSFSLSGFYFQLLAAMGWTSIHRLRRLLQPTLLLAGRDDPLIPVSNAIIMEKLMANAKLIKFNCGHLFPFTRAEKVAQEILDFRR